MTRAESVRLWVPSTWPYRRRHLKWMIPTGVFLIAAYVVTCWPYLRREVYVDGIRERAEPLIVAIESYHRDHGWPPHELGDIVPDYVAAVPQTGFGPQSEFRFNSNHIGWTLSVSMGILDLSDECCLRYGSDDGYWSGPDAGRTRRARWPSTLMARRDASGRWAFVDR